MIKYLVFLGSAWVQLSCTGKKWISVIVVIRPVFPDPVTYERLSLTYHKGQKLSKRKDLQSSGLHPNVGKTFAVFALAVWNVKPLLD